ncbi:MFS transporter [Larkinella insperata]|uniref:MFS transporter n=1 Tax=Larkinella insperata TaxID=332158 RepID=A0ABW3Q217_9BACT|nr:MFS transporter [Larkinella insperata]
MTPARPVFKPWVPEWLVRVTIFLVLLPGLFILGIYAGNVTEAAGYYGIEPADVQFSIVIYYAALTSFFPLEQRFLSFFATKHYFLLGLFLLTASNLVFYNTHHPAVFIGLRFLEGIFSSGVAGSGMTLLFSRLETSRARTMGYSIFYGILLCSAPLSLMLAAWLLTQYDFNVLYKALIYLQVPGAALLMVTMNDVRIKRRIPLYQIDGISFVFYAVVLTLTGYLLVYGQQYNWLEDPRIRAGALTLFLLLGCFLLRQTALKRPYINLTIFRYRNYRIGLLLLVVLYVCRGALGQTSSFLANALGLDPLHISYLMLANLVGVILSMTVTARLLLLNKNRRLMWLTGFGLLAFFHGMMYSLFAARADASTYVLPLFIQGLGVGALMVPVVSFTVSAVPAAVGPSATAVGVVFRFLGFTLSMALINFFQLLGKSRHYHQLQESVTQLNPYTAERLGLYRQQLLNGGLAPDQAGQAASKLLGKAVDLQAQLQYFMDYYALIAALLLAVMMLIVLFPFARRTLTYFSSRVIPY